VSGNRTRQLGERFQGVRFQGDRARLVLTLRIRCQTLARRQLAVNQTGIVVPAAGVAWYGTAPL